MNEREWFHVFRFGRHWLRVGWHFGSAPGSHRGIWRTSGYGLHGLNIRIGPLRRCWTGLVHYQQKG